jgi:exo-beta-1,3-glucanase (GH17 family)
VVIRPFGNAGIEQKIFISYRWHGGAEMARLVRDSMQKRGYNVFMDVEDLRSGPFNTALFHEIESATDMVVVLTPGSLDRCQQEGDWLRLEVAHAIKHKKNIVPVMTKGFQWPSQSLPEDLSSLPTYNGIAPSHEYFEASIDKLSTLLVGKPKLRATRRKVVYVTIGIAVAFFVTGGTLFVSRLGRQYFEPEPSKSYGREYETRLNSFLGALPWLNWIVYDPTDYNPYANKMPSQASIRQDLEVLRRYGFNGLITMTSRDACGNIPRIAHEVGFNMVIAGVWDLRDQNEVRNALDVASFADAYSLGHKGLNKIYTQKELLETMDRFRNEAKRPVTTTEVIADYEANPALLKMSDFLFPDVHAYWHEGKSPKDAWSETLAMARQASILSADKKRNVLLKTISYPSGGAAGLSQNAQREFYRLAVEEARERTDLPGNVSFSFLCAFDPKWKTKEFGWQEPERHTGLFTVERKPKPAVTHVNWKKHQ